MRRCMGILLTITVMMMGGTAWGAVQVLRSFDDSVSMTDFLDNATTAFVSDTPGPSSTQSLRITVAADDWQYWAEDDPPYMFITGINFSPALDMTQHDYINFYIKGTSSNALAGQWISATDTGASGGSGIGPEDPALPATWTYVSFAIADFESQWKAWGNMSAVPRLQWVFTSASSGDMTIYLDHITLSDTPAEGMIPEGPPPADCTDPFLAQSGIPVAGEEFSIVVGGIDEGCAESITWTRDGVEIPQDACATISPAGAIAGTIVTVDTYDQNGNKLDLVRDVGDGWAEAGFAKVVEVLPRALLFDHITLSDTPANGMLGASGGFFLLSACEDGDLPSSMGNGEDLVGALNTTDAAGAGSTACAEVPVADYCWLWCEYYGANVDASGVSPQYLNFYVKVADGQPWDGWGSAGMGGDDEWGSGYWGDGVWTVPAGAGWQYVSISIYDNPDNVWGDPDWSTLAAAGVEFGQNGNQYYSVTNDANPEAFETGSCVFELTQDMVDSTYFWTWTETVWGDGVYVEINPTSDALTNGGNCGGAKALTSIGADGTLTFSPLSEDDAGEYCATVTIDGTPTEICTTIENIAAEGSLPAAGLAALGLLAAACGLGGFVAIRRKK